MPASTAKSVFTTIGIHEKPTHLTKEAFHANLHALAETHLGLPGGKHILKYRLVLPNDRLDEVTKALGLPPPQPIAFAVVDCETPGHLAEFLRDEAVRNSISAAPEFQHGATLFSADAGVRIDEGSQEGSFIAGGIFRRPAHLSTQQFYQTLDQFADSFCALPITKKNTLNYTMWMANETAADAVQGLNVPVTKDSIVVVVFEGKSFDAVMEIAKGSELKELTKGLEKSGVLDGAYWFSADSVTRYNKA